MKDEIPKRYKYAHLPQLKGMLLYIHYEYATDDMGFEPIWIAPCKDSGVHNDNWFVHYIDRQTMAAGDITRFEISAPDLLEAIMRMDGRYNITIPKPVMYGSPRYEDACRIIGVTWNEKEKCVNVQFDDDSFLNLSAEEYVQFEKVGATSGIHQTVLGQYVLYLH